MTVWEAAVPAVCGAAVLAVCGAAVLAAAICLGSGGAFADEAVMPEGFHEVVFSVSDLEGAASFYQEVAGWEIVHRGRTGSDVAKFWRLEDGQEIQEILLANPGDDHGHLRLVAFSGADQRQIRSNAQTWETGGIFDITVRVLDIHKKFAQFRERGWQFYSDPIQFQFGPFVVWEVLAKGPDGVVIAMTERVEPPLEGWPNLRELSHAFNSTQIVRDFDRSRAFYEEALGFKVYLEHEGPSKEPGPNVLGLPHNFAAEVPRRVVILSPDGSNAGSVELIAFDGLTGADFSEHASPPNLGILALRFPVPDLTLFTHQIVSRGCVPVAGPSSVTIEPYGTVNVLAVRAPEGALLEFYETPKTDKAGAEEE